MNLIARRFFALCAAAFLVSAPAYMQAKDGELRLRTELKGARFNGVVPSGHADFRSQPGRSRLNVEVEDINLPPGTVLIVRLDGVTIGNITIDATTRGGELEFNSQDGDRVPQAKQGSVVVVRTADRALVAGIF